MKINRRLTALGLAYSPTPVDLSGLGPVSDIVGTAWPAGWRWA